MGKQSDLGDESGALIATVKKELTALRGAQGILDAQKFNNYPNLVRVCGGDDLLEAFLMFGREMRRYASEGNRNEAAAALSITAPAETVLDRLEYVVGLFEEHGQIRDQRTGRRWSDKGISAIAKDLVYMAEVKGRLGTEMLTIEIDGGCDEGLFLSIYQLTTKNLDETAPLNPSNPDGIGRAASTILVTGCSIKLFIPAVVPCFTFNQFNAVVSP